MIITETITALTSFCNHRRMKKNFRPIIWWILLSSDCIFFNWQARKACGLKQVVCKKAWAFVQNAVLGHHWTQQRFVLVIFCLMMACKHAFFYNLPAHYFLKWSRCTNKKDKIVSTYTALWTVNSKGWFDEFDSNIRGPRAPHIEFSTIA